jgi:hypothetical protein
MTAIMSYADERLAGEPCGRKQCNYYDERAEQCCSAGYSDDSPYLPYCKYYMPKNNVKGERT